MIQVLKQTIIDKKRDATSIDDFYYRGLEDKLNGKLGTGIRTLAYTFIQESKILDRFLILNDIGDTLHITTVFKNKDFLQEFLWHPIMHEVNEIFSEKQWTFTSEIYPATGYLSVRNM